MVSSALNRVSTNAAIRTLLLSHSLSLKSSSIRFLEILRPLLIIFEISLEETLSIN